MDVLAKDGVVEHLLEREVVAVARRDGVRRRLRVHGDAAGLVQVHVRARVEDDRVRRLREVRADRELVRLRARTRERQWVFFLNIVEALARCCRNERRQESERRTHHGARDAEQARLLAGHLGDLVLQVVSRLVLLRAMKRCESPSTSRRARPLLGEGAAARDEREADARRRRRRRARHRA